MRVREEEMKISLLSAAVLGALTAMAAVPAYAADTSDEEMAAIRRPSNFVEIGAINVDQSSAKFGEYNGLDKSGVRINGNFSVKGGDSYEGGDGTLRWGVTGTDIGTTSREFGATVGRQGSWNVGVGFDELRHNITDTYQTPYVGPAGGNSFTLPAGFGLVPNTNTMNAGQLSAFHTMDIGSTRKNTSFSAGFNLTPHLDVKLEYNRLDQTGAKLMSFGSDGTGGGGSGEKISILPNPTNYTTDTVNLSLNWSGEKAHLTTSYFGSYFRDGYDRVTWTTFAGSTATDTMTTPPGNDFHQFNLAGGYDLTAKTKLAGGVSYSRNTQNDSFVPTPLSIGTLPSNSLNGLVVNTHADLKLTDQSFKDLSLAAGIKYDKRDNRTQSNIYDFFAISNANAAPFAPSNRATYPNTPLSTKRYQVELAADYRLTKGQNLRLAVNHDEISRWCDSYAVSALYPSGTNCVVATGSKEDKGTLGYRYKASDNLNLSAAYSYAEKKTDFDIFARTAMLSTNGLVVTAISANGKVLTGTLVPGQNGGDFIGFHPYLDENRNEQMLKLGANWQATDRLSFGFSGRYTDDIYDTQYGWKTGNQWSVNLDASYTYSETGAISTYVTQQSRERKRTDIQKIALSDSTATAINLPNYATNNGSLKDDDFTVGLGFKEGALMRGKLTIIGDLSYTVGKTDYGTTLNWAGVTLPTAGVVSTCSSAAILSCGDLPSIKNTLTQFKLTSTYQLDKASKVGVGYLYQHLTSNDYYYNGVQTGFTPSSLMPSNQQANHYTVNLLMANYIYSF